MSRESLVARAKAKEELDHRRIDARCSQDAFHWLTEVTATYDPHAEKGVSSRRPFPKLDWIKWALHYFSNWERYPRVAMPKSRQVLASWLAAGYATHLCQYRAYTQVLVQTETEKKAERLVQYCKSLYSGQPDWLRKMHPLRNGYTDIRIAKDSKLELIFENGSEIVGIPSGPSGIASYHPTVYIQDESGLLDDAQGSYQLAHPVCKQIICLGSARPGWWAEICSDEAIDPQSTGELIREMIGVTV